ncbi:MAG: PEP-CTERM sorting domain-containing protein [Pirellulales bacterium]|nr:PEP-CTERM sorting domain-containing protein [Pirellulales bacterium]
MKKLAAITVVLAFAASALPMIAMAQTHPDFNGHVENSTTDYGWYAVITGGIAENGQTRNGTQGTMWYINDDPNYTHYPNGYQQWKRDGWFEENKGLALTMRYQNSIVFDNNGIDTNSAPADFYGIESSPSTITPGLYCGESMSNNNDWIYAGYFLIDETTTVDQISGYFAETYYHTIAPYLDSGVWDFRMNIFSTEVNGEYVEPVVDSFVGDVFTTDSASGTFAVEDSGVVRHYSGFSNNDDIIYRLTFTLDSPITLEPGEYFFSHDALLVPEPGTIALLIFGGLTALAAAWFRRK